MTSGWALTNTPADETSRKKSFRASRLSPPGIGSTHTRIVVFQTEKGFEGFWPIELAVNNARDRLASGSPFAIYTLRIEHDRSKFILKRRCNGAADDGFKDQTA